MRYLFIIAIVWMSMSAGQVYGQAMSGSAQGNFLVYSIQSINITPLGGVISFNSPNDYFNGVVVNDYTNIRIKSNENWTLSFASQSTYFSPLSKGASTDMPAGVLGIRISGRNSFKQLSTQSQTLTDGNRGSSSGRHDFNIDVSMEPGFGYSGGLYSIGIMYTLTRQ